MSKHSPATGESINLPAEIILDTTHVMRCPFDTCARCTEIALRYAPHGVYKTLEEAIRTARTSALSETPRSEPIAWYSEHDGGGAQLRLTIYEKPKKEVPGVEWIPLYAAPVSAVSATRPICPFCNPAALYANPNNTRAEGPPAIDQTRKRCATCPYLTGCMVGDCDDHG